jgi:hypothetical protein
LDYDAYAFVVEVRHDDYYIFISFFVFFGGGGDIPLKP